MRATLKQHGGYWNKSSLRRQNLGQGYKIRGIAWQVLVPQEVKIETESQLSLVLLVFTITMPFALARSSLELSNTFCVCPRKNKSCRTLWVLQAMLPLPLSEFLAPKVCLHWSFVFGMSWHSIAGSSFTSDFSFHGFEETNESCTASYSAAEDRPLNPSISDHGEEQLSAQGDTASSRRQGKKRPREVSEKRLVSEADGRKHDVTSKQHNGEAHHSLQVNSEKISHDTPRPKAGPIVDLRVSDAGMNDLRFEALISRINKVESYLEEIVHHITINDSRCVTVSPPKKRKVEMTTETQVRSRPTPAVGCAESYIQTEDLNDDTVSVLADEDFSDQEEQNISYQTKDYTQHIFDPEPNLKRGVYSPWSNPKICQQALHHRLSPVMEETLIQEECGLPIIEDFVVPKVNPQIVNSEKVQQNRNIVEGDKRVSEIQDSAFAASWPLISLWNKIVTSDEDIEAEEVLDRLQQSLMCIGSAFKGLSVHRHKHFQSCLTKEFSSLTDEKDPASDKLSEYLFGNDLSEQIKQQLET